jgi:uncharacterized protein
VAIGTDPMDAMPAVGDLGAFDAHSGGRIERLIFEHRRTVVATSVVLTVVLGWLGATRHVLNADFESMIPAHHPFVQSWTENRTELRGLGNSLRVALENTRGDVYDPDYLEALRQLTDELFLMPGVDRAWVRSLWMPAVRWTEVTEEGFRGGPVMPDDYDASPAAIDALRRNVARAGIVGSVVAHDARSTIVFVPLLDRDPVTGAGIDYRTLTARLEELREGLERRGNGKHVVHIVGFAKLVGDLLRGMAQVAGYFTIAAAVVSAVLFVYTRSLRCTAVVVGCSAMAVVWQVGLVSALGVALDPFSMLVPFLVFAMGISHGVQKMNGIVQDVGRGTHRLIAARYTFRRLFLAGLTALLTDVAAFAVLAIVDVPAIRRVALTATIGALVLVFTNLVLVPVLLSFTGVGAAAASRTLRTTGANEARAWRFLERFAERRWAAGALATFAAAVAIAALAVGVEARVGDLDPGAPELRPSSRYNRDNAFITANYGVSDDLFAVIVKTREDGCLAYRTLIEADRLGWALRQIPSVHGTTSLADAVRQITAGSFEGSPKWLTLSRDQEVLNYAAQQAITRNPDLFNLDCSVMPVIAYLSDHKAETLDELVHVGEEFERNHGGPERKFLLAAGNAGLQAATNAVVREAAWTMTLLVYAAVILLGFLTLRSWRAVATMVLPLAATSVLCEALMIVLGIGVKLDTLPVISLGVGIPDYALYLLAVQLPHQRAGLPLREAYARSLRFTGKAVVLVGCTLAAAVVTWAGSPIKLQADMGILLTFMFLANMVAALVLVPSLSHFLLNHGEPDGGRA